MNKLLNSKELGDYLNLKQVTIRRKAAKGKIPAIKIGNHFRFNKEEIDNWLLQNRTGKQQHILVVDNEPIVGQLFKDSLDGHGYRVTTILSSLEALELVRNNHFDLIFIDLLMPELDGDELFRQIRLMNSSVPVVIITGYPNSEIMNRAMEHGPIMVLGKPFTGDDILTIIHSLTRGVEIKR